MSTHEQRPYAMLSSPVLTATVESRREQLLAYHDQRGLDFARLIVRGKIRNQRHLLLYFGKYLKQSDAARFDIVSPTARKLRALELQARRIEGTAIAEKRAELMGLEGVAGRLYWEGVRTIVESKAEFMGRVASRNRFHLLGAGPPGSRRCIDQPTEGTNIAAAGGD